MNTTTPTLRALLNETLLVQRLVARDERALRLLYERYADSLRAVIWRVVRDETLVQDVLQEGLLKVWGSIGSYDASRGRLYTWLARLCCNCAIDALRSPRHRFHRGTQSLDVAGAQQASAALTFCPEHIGVRELTLQLKPRQREVIDLLYFGGCTPTETAKELGIPVPTVKTRARAAIKALVALTHERARAGGDCHQVRLRRRQAAAGPGQPARAHPHRH